MLSRIVAFFLAMSVAVPAAAQCVGENLIDAMSPAERATLEAEIAAAPFPEGNLWRAERDGRTVHVLGTVHIPDPRLDPIFEEAAPLLAASDLLILEATTEAQAGMQKLMVEKPDLAYITEGPTLIDLLGDEDWAKVSEELRARGVPPVLASKFRPWLLSMTLAIPQCAMRAITEGDQGLDARLETQAKADGIPIATLDDVEALLEHMTSGTLEEQIEMLKMTLSLDQDQDAMMATTLDSYFAGRHRELWEFSKALADQSGIDPGVFEELEATLLNGRNTDWAERLPALIEGKNAFIAVGAAHLSGETGMLKTLEKLGYTMTRL